MSSGCCSTSPIAPIRLCGPTGAGQRYGTCTGNANNVKIHAEIRSIVLVVNRSAYHHGNLRDALMDATADLIAREGTSGFSLRKAAKLAGVSPSAPAHHFGDSKGLLTAVASEGFRHLIAAFEAVDSSLPPFERLIQCNRAYVRVAQERPGHIAVMFRTDLVDRLELTHASLAATALEMFSKVVADALQDAGSDADVELTTKTIWATCHGIVHLFQSGEGGLDSDPALLRLVDFSANIVRPAAS